MLINILAILIGLFFLTFSADWLVAGAVGLARRMGVSPLFIGMTVIAMGTSMPELVVSVQSSINGNAGIVVGNVVGSNIFNIAMILGISALIKPIPCSRQVVRREVPVMILVSALFWWMAFDRFVSNWESVILLVLLVLYTTISYALARRDAIAGIPEQALAGEVKTLWCDLGNIGMGFAGLVGGSKLLLYGAVLIAQTMGVSDEIIGLTLIAVGTSLPELATSVVAAWKGQPEIAIGNVVGSNMMNILAILGISGCILPMHVSEHMAAIDIPVMFFVSLGCLPIMKTGYSIVRTEGLLLLTAYLGYMYLLFLAPS